MIKHVLIAIFGLHSECLQWCVNNVISSTRAQIILPPNPNGASAASFATLYVSNNGVDFSVEGPILQYQTDMIVDSVFPSMIPETGNVLIKIKGEHFVEPLISQGQYKCSFGGSSSSSTYAPSKPTSTDTSRPSIMRYILDS